MLVREADFLAGVQGQELLVVEEQLHVEEAGVVEQVHLVEEVEAGLPSIESALWVTTTSNF